MFTKGNNAAPDINDKDFEGVYIKEKKGLVIIFIPIVLIFIVGSLYMILGDFSIQPGEYASWRAKRRAETAKPLGFAALLCFTYMLYRLIKRWIKPETLVIISEQGIGMWSHAYGMHFVNWKDVGRVYIEDDIVAVFIKTPEKMPKQSIINQIINTLSNQNSKGDIDIGTTSFPCSEEEIVKTISKYTPKEVEQAH